MGSGVGSGLGVGVGVGVGSVSSPVISKLEPLPESDVNKRPPVSDEPMRSCAWACVLAEVVPSTSLPTAALTLGSANLIVISLPFI